MKKMSHKAARQQNKKHMDVKEDKALIKKMVKPACRKK